MSLYERVLFEGAGGSKIEAEILRVIKGDMRSVSSVHKALKEVGLQVPVRTVQSTLLAMYKAGTVKRAKHVGPAKRKRARGHTHPGSGVSTAYVYWAD